MSKRFFIKAISNRDLDGVYSFLRREGDINEFKHMKMTPLVYALHTCEPSETGNIDEIISRLIDKGAEVNAMYERNGMTATMLAINKDRSDEIVLKFIEAGTDVRVTCQRGKTTLDHALENNCGKPVIRVLIDKGSDVRNHRSYKTPLYYAVRIIKDPEIIEMILIKGGVINPSEFGRPLLALCCQERCKIDDICRFKRTTDILIKRGVNIKESDDEGNTIFHQATCNYVFHLAQKHGVSINTANNFGITPLFQSLIPLNEDKVNDLLLIGADPNWRDRQGNTLLHNIGFLNETCVPMLLYHGADFLAVNHAGETPIDLIFRDQRFLEDDKYFMATAFIIRNYLLYENKNGLDNIIDRLNLKKYTFIKNKVNYFKVQLDEMKRFLLKENLSVYQFCLLKRFYSNSDISIKIDQYLIDYNTISIHFLDFEDVILMRLKDNSRKNFKHNLLESMNSISVSAASTTNGDNLGYKLVPTVLYIIGKYLNYRQLYALISMSFNR